MLLCLTAVMATGGGNDGCNGKGNQNPRPSQRPKNWPGDHANPDGNLSYDPNEIIGPEGYDSVRWVSINDVLNYTIMFENDPEFATANAQRVSVSFPFATQSEIKGFGLGAFGFANRSFSIENSPAAYNERLDMRDSMNIYVDLTAAVDVVNQQAFWLFNSIDPDTGIAPWQSDRGVLPVNDSTHVGEGFVTFTLKPQENLHTGDTISIQASIVFDQNDTIPTNRWCNKIDAGNPVSRVTAELHPTLPNTYNLKFTGNDDEGGSGLKHLLIYLANHNGIYEEIDTVVVDSVLAFPVEAGKQYKLYSIAFDNTGNREPAKMEPDVILNFNQAPTDLILSDSIFQDDLAAGGFIGKLTTVDSEDEKTFTYALAEGDGAVHNDLFQITEDRLEIKNSFKCADGDCFNVRISTTDDGGMSYSKAFKLNLEKVLIKPKTDTLKVDICEGETCLFHGREYSNTGSYAFSQSNDFMCDSVFVLELAVHKPLEMPVVTVEGTSTLVSSAVKGNQWFRQEGTMIEGADDQRFTPEEDGVYYVAASNGTCFSEPSLLYQVMVTDKMDLTLDLKPGWNWVSSNMTSDNMRDAKSFISPIAEQTNRLVGVSSELTNDPEFGLVGNLTTLAPQQGYKLYMKESANHTWSGMTAKPETTTMTLYKGWNWIGYIPVVEQTLGNAFATLSASENDVIKCEDDFATFYGGQWIGSFEKLTPGKGYMYFSDKETSFTYPFSRVTVVENSADSRKMENEIARSVAPWQYDEYQYPDNMTVIARLNIDDMTVADGAYSVGAFCGSECRGIGKYVNGLLFLTIHGTLSDSRQVSFKAVENLTGKELSIIETVNFNGQHIGTIAQPMILNAKDNTTGVEEFYGKYNIYPKPLRNKLYINGPTENIKAIYVLSANGKKVVSANGYSEEGIDVSSLLSGVYVVGIQQLDDRMYYEKVVKAN